MLVQLGLTKNLIRDAIILLGSKLLQRKAYVTLMHRCAGKSQS